jgi:acyl-CoA reductase-like NAD-dependent aldehyde dehydrogenase
VELGGSATGIVFEDADIDLAVENICFNRLFNQGQCYDGLKRLLVHESIFDEVVAKIAKNFRSMKIGNPQDFNT